LQHLIHILARLNRFSGLIGLIGAIEQQQLFFQYRLENR